MKVLLVTGEFPPLPGGISDYTRLLRDALRDRHIESAVLSLDGSLADVTLKRWSWNVASYVREALETTGADLVHIQYQAGAFDMHPAINLLPRRLEPVPVVTTFHDLRQPYLFPKAGRLRAATVMRMARWSKAVIVTNPADSAVLARAGIDSSQIRVGPSLPQPASNIAPMRTVGYFGYPSRQKGFDILVQALGSIPDATRPDLWIVGSPAPSDGSHGFYSDGEVAELAGQSRVKLIRTGFLKPQEAAESLASMGVIALPFPAGATLRSSALIAVLQSGRPVLTTRPDPFANLAELTTLPNLHMLNRNDERALAVAVCETIQHPTCVPTLPEPFTWSTIARQHLDLYSQVMSTTWK